METHTPHPDEAAALLRELLDTVERLLEIARNPGNTTLPQTAAKIKALKNLSSEAYASAETDGLIDSEQLQVISDFVAGFFVTGKLFTTDGTGTRRAAPQFINYLNLIRFLTKSMLALQRSRQSRHRPAGSDRIVR